MGVDIHMFIVRKDQIIRRNIFDGRNSEWFNNLQGDNYDNEYNYLPRMSGLPEEVPAEIKKIYDGVLDEYRGYYGFNYMTVRDFIQWFDKYRPDMDACWVNTYDQWRIEHKNYIPEDPKHYLDKDDNINDMHFVTYIKKYDCSKWLVDYLMDNDDITGDDVIIYYFDC